MFSSVHNRAFNYNSSALFEYVKKYHPEIQAFYVMEDPVERKKLQVYVHCTAVVWDGISKKILYYQSVAWGTVKKNRDGAGKSWMDDKAVLQISVCG